MADDGCSHWAGYYAWSAARDPRPMLLAACARLGAGAAMDQELAVLRPGPVPWPVGTHPAGAASGGAFAGQLCGTHDSWAGHPGMVFHDRREVENLLDGLEILELHETERDGEVFSGPKQWHFYDIVARGYAGSP